MIQSSSLLIDALWEEAAERDRKTSSRGPLPLAGSSSLNSLIGATQAGGI